MRAHSKLLAAALAVFLSHAAGAASASTADFDALRAEQAQIAAEVSARKAAYEGISPADRDALLERQAAVLKLIEGRRSVDELAPEERAQLEESLQWIRKTIAGAGEERQVCEFRKTLGSNRKERVCTTAGQQREQRDAAQRQMHSREIR